MSGFNTKERNNYGEYEITGMLFAGPVVSYGKYIVSVVTCNGKTVITRHKRVENKSVI